MNEMELLERVTIKKISPSEELWDKSSLMKTVIAVASLIFPVGWHSGSDNATNALPLERVSFWEMQDQNHFCLEILVFRKVQMYPLWVICVKTRSKSGVLTS